MKEVAGPRVSTGISSAGSTSLRTQCPCTCPPIYPSMHLSTYPSVHPFMYPAVHPAVYPSTYLSMHLSTYLSMYPSMCLPVHVSVYLACPRPEPEPLALTSRLYTLNPIPYTSTLDPKPSTLKFLYSDIFPPPTLHHHPDPYTLTPYS